MNPHQRLFLVQARSGYGVFTRIRAQNDLHPCHMLHYLQMATEKLGKAHAWKTGPPAGTHKAFRGFLKSLLRNRSAQAQLGYAHQNAQWQQLVRKCGPFADGIEKLAPALAGDGPNPEYPWPRDAPDEAPAEYDFALWHDLAGTQDGRRFLDLLGALLQVAETYL